MALVAATRRSDAPTGAGTGPVRRGVPAVIDLIVKGGTVVDGTGGPARRADVGVDGGRIVAVGDVGDSATRVIDAEGAIVAPGFVDLHTHYDAQLFWDPSASPSPLHGVTTVFGGNCGFSLAPAGPEHAEYLARMMARVEGMPLAALEAGLDWSWDSFGEWLGRLDGAVGVNAGFLVGHSTLRRAVMGDDAVDAVADGERLEQLEAALHRALSEGAMGFSSSTAPTHNDGDGRPVPSRAAGPGELERLAAVVADHPGTTVELIVPGCLNGFSDEEMDLLTRVSLAARRPVNWNVLAATAGNADGTAHQLEASDRAARAGGRVVALTLPHTMALRLSFEHGAILEGLPDWRRFFATSVDERVAVLSDPAARAAMDDRAQSDEAGILRFLANWSQLVVAETFSPVNAGLEGRSVGSVAADRGIGAWDALCEIVVADRLRTGFSVPIPESDADWKARAEVWRDPRAVVGRLGRRCPPRHHVRGRLLHVAAGRGGAPAPAPHHGGGGPPPDRGAGPALRAGRPRPGGRGVVGRPGRLRPGHGRARAPAHPQRPARRGQPPVRRCRRDRPRAGQRHRRWSPTAGSPGRCRDGSSARGPTRPRWGSRPRSDRRPPRRWRNPAGSAGSRQPGSSRSSWRAMASKNPMNPSPSDAAEEGPGRARGARVRVPTASTCQARRLRYSRATARWWAARMLPPVTRTPWLARRAEVGRCPSTPPPGRRPSGESTGPSYSSTRTGSPPPRAELWS